MEGRHNFTKIIIDQSNYIICTIEVGDIPRYKNINFKLSINFLVDSTLILILAKFLAKQNYLKFLISSTSFQNLTTRPIHLVPTPLRVVSMTQSRDASHRMQSEQILDAKGGGSIHPCVRQLSTILVAVVVPLNSTPPA